MLCVIFYFIEKCVNVFGFFLIVFWNIFLGFIRVGEGIRDFKLEKYYWVFFSSRYEEKNGRVLGFCS